MSWARVHPLELKVQQRIRYRPHGRKAKVGEGRIRAIARHGAIVRTGQTREGTELLALVALEQIEAAWVNTPAAPARRLARAGRGLRERLSAGKDLTGFPPLAG